MYMCIYELDNAKNCCTFLVVSFILSNRYTDVGDEIHFRNLFRFFSFWLFLLVFPYLLYII